MKRSGIKRRTPMNRGSGEWLRKPRKPLAYFSKKRKAEQPARYRCLDVVRARAHGMCELRTPVCEGRGTHGHERLTRKRGGDDTDPANVMWSCWPCNQYAHNHNSESLKKGWIASRIKDDRREINQSDVV